MAKILPDYQTGADTLMQVGKRDDIVGRFFIRMRFFYRIYNFLFKKKRKDYFHLYFIFIMPLSDFAHIWVGS